MVSDWSMFNDSYLMIRDWSLLWYQELVSDDQGLVSDDQELISDDQRLVSDEHGLVLNNLGQVSDD